MDAILIIEGIYFSQCSDAGKTYYIINMLYNTINIWCHKSASCLLGLLATGVWILQSNWRSLICLQHGRTVYNCFTKIPKAQAMCLYESIIKDILPCCAQILVSLCLLLHTSLLVQTKILMTNDFLSTFHVNTSTLNRCSGAGCLPSSLTVLRQSIYYDLARIDGGDCRDCGVDSMLQDLSTDRHTAWQLQNGAIVQPSDLLDVT